MSKSQFCHLHLHTCYSLLDSTLKIKDALITAKDMGMDYLAITDHAVLYGAVEFYRAAETLGIKPIIEIFVKNVDETGVLIEKMGSPKIID